MNELTGHTDRMAAEQGLHPVYRQEFHEVYSEHEGHAEFGPLMVRMKVKNEHGESQMDEDQWEAASEWLSASFMQNMEKLMGVW